MTKILLCGPLPEPVGGVSVHIERLGLLLKSEGLIVLYCDESAVRNETKFNIRTLNLKTYISLLKSVDKVHIHSSVAVFRLVHIVCARILSKKTIVTIHSWRGGKLSSAIWGCLMNFFCHKVVFVSDAVSQKIPVASSKKFVFPAFIPPTDSSQELPAAIREFSEKIKFEGEKLAVSNAFRLIDFNDEDLYGLDLCIKAFENRDLDGVASLVFVIADPSANSEKINRYLLYIKENSLENKILIHLGAVNFYKLLLLSDFSIRATNSDGDALSIRESIFLNKPCIASDVVERPCSSTLFENRSSDSLIQKIKQVSKIDLQDLLSESCSESEVVSFYKELYF